MHQSGTPGLDIQTPVAQQPQVGNLPDDNSSVVPTPTVTLAGDDITSTAPQPSNSNLPPDVPAPQEYRTGTPARRFPTRSEIGVPEPTNRLSEADLDIKNRALRRRDAGQIRRRLDPLLVGSRTEPPPSGVGSGDDEEHFSEAIADLNKLFTYKLNTLESSIRALVQTNVEELRGSLDSATARADDRHLSITARFDKIEFVQRQLLQYVDARFYNLEADLREGLYNTPPVVETGDDAKRTTVHRTVQQPDMQPPQPAVQQDVEPVVQEAVAGTAQPPVPLVDDTSMITGRIKHAPVQSPINQDQLQSILTDLKTEIKT